MDQMTNQEALQHLRQAGFTETEMKWLDQLRRTYQTSDLDQPVLDPRRLAFARWLVATGRLTDQLPEGEALASSSSHL